MVRPIKLGALGSIKAKVGAFFGIGASMSPMTAFASPLKRRTQSPNRAVRALSAWGTFDHLCGNNMIASGALAFKAMIGGRFWAHSVSRTS